MPDTNFPEVTRAEKNLLIMLFEPKPDQKLLRRKWLCPGDHAIAAYADGVLSKRRQAWIEFHLLGCERCRLVVAGIIKAQREFDLPLPPVDIMRKAMCLDAQLPVPRQWIWASAGAMAAVALLAMVPFVLRDSPQLVVMSPRPPAAPLVAKSEAPPLLRTPVKDVTRKRATPELLLTILSPENDAVMPSDRVEFRWKSVSHSRNYEVRVVRSDGDLVWEGQTQRSALQVPAKLGVKDGSYFVWITAYLKDGRTVKSAPVHFLIKR